MTNTTSDAAADGEPDHHDAMIGSYGYSIGILLAVIVFLLIITYTYHIYARKRNSNIPTTGQASNSSSPDNNGTPQRGLDDETINAFPEHLYSKVKNCRGEGGGTGCSVCLQDYKDVEMIRILPECGHFFHKICVDPWLRLNPTCPICRKLMILSETPDQADSEPTRPW